MRKMLGKTFWTLVMAILVSSAAVFGITGDTITTNSGLKYIITEKGDGIRATVGDKVSAHYTGKFTNGEVFDSSVDRGTPFEFTLGKGQVIRGWDEGFALMNVGDKAILIIPYHLAYGEAGKPPQIPARSILIFDVELLDVMVSVKAIPFEVEGIKEKSTESGLKYQVVKKGSGRTPQAGQIVIVHYTGYLTNGMTFDSSVEREQPFQFHIGRQRVIAGWDEGVAMMKLGEQRRFTIPPDLAYGAKGYPNLVPPNSTLIFDIELISIKNAQTPK